MAGNKDALNFLRGLDGTVMVDELVYINRICRNRWMIFKYMILFVVAAEGEVFAAKHML